MKRAGSYVEPLVLSLLAMATVLAGILSRHTPVGLETARKVLLFYGISTGILSLASVVMIRIRRCTLLSKLHDGLRSLARETRTFIGWVLSSAGGPQDKMLLLSLVAIGMSIRSFFLDEPLRYDEAFTFMEFARDGVYGVFAYLRPNNHVLHTILVSLTTGLLGPAPVAIRLPAFLAGVATMVALFGLARLVSGMRGGFAAVGLVAFWPYVILFDTMARGYSLVNLLAVTLALIGLRLILSPSSGLVFLFSVVSALGILTMPSFLLPLVGLYIWVSVALLIKGITFRRVISGFALPSCAFTSILTFVLYTPAIIASGGLTRFVNIGATTGGPMDQFLGRMPDHIGNTLSDMTRNVPIWFVAVLILCGCLGVFRLVRQKNWVALLLVPILLVGAAIALASKHAVPFSRTWIFLLPFCFIVVDVGLTSVFAGKSPSVQLRVNLLLLASFGCYGFTMASRGVIGRYRDTGRFAEAPVVADYLAGQIRRGDRIAFAVPASFPLYYYLWRKGPRAGSPDEKQRSPREYLVVEKSTYSVRDLTGEDVTELAEIGDAEIYVRDLHGAGDTLQSGFLIDRLARPDGPALTSVQ